MLNGTLEMSYGVGEGSKVLGAIRNVWKDRSYLGGRK